MNDPGWQRVANYIAAHPGATAMEIMLNCATANHSGRISEARQHGWEIECDMSTSPPGYTARRIVGQGDATCAPPLSERGEPVSRTEAPLPRSGDSAPMSCDSPPSQGTLDF